MPRRKLEQFRLKSAQHYKAQKEEDMIKVITKVRSKGMGLKRAQNQFIVPGSTLKRFFVKLIDTPDFFHFFFQIYDFSLPEFVWQIRKGTLQL